jgi:hypothetical protein
MKAFNKGIAGIAKITLQDVDQRGDEFWMADLDTSDVSCAKHTEAGHRQRPQSLADMVRGSQDIDTHPGCRVNHTAVWGITRAYMRSKLRER